VTNNKLNQLREANKQRWDSITAEGAQLHPLTLIDAKLDALIEHFGCHRKLEEAIAQRLDEAVQQLAHAKLTHGLTLPNFGKDGKA